MRNLQLLPLLLLLTWIGSGCVPPPDTRSAATGGLNLSAAHGPGAAGADDRCVSCHSGQDQGVALDNRTVLVHATHLNNRMLAFTCTTCHPSVDLQEHSAAGLRSQVDHALCRQCHSPFPTAMEASLREQKCVTCHADWKSGAMARRGYVKLSAVTEADCLTCHGAKSWYL